MMDSKGLLKNLQRSGNPGAILGQSLIKVLREQQRLYRELSTLARSQSECVATGESEALMSILAARHRIIEQVAPLDRQLQPYKGRWQEVLNTLSTEDRQAVAELLRDVQGLLAEILERDEADKDSLIRQKAEVASQLSQTVTGTQLNKAYGMGPRSGGLFKV